MSKKDTSLKGGDSLLKNKSAFVDRGVGALSRESPGGWIKFRQDSHSSSSRAKKKKVRRRGTTLNPRETQGSEKQVEASKRRVSQP